MEGFKLLPGYLCADDQAALLAEIEAVVAAAPLFVPCMPKTGKPFSVRMTNCGTLGWVSDKALGYRYEATHPETGQPWPPMPRRLLALWAQLAGCEGRPEACLVNSYGPKARMGMHRDEDEADFAAPLISVSLGATAMFRLGGLARGDPSRTFELRAGDVLVLGGRARLAYHGVDRILAWNASARRAPGADTSSLLAGGGRINLTLRRVTRLG